MSASILGRTLLPSLLNVGGDIAGGAAGLYFLYDTIEILKKNPIIPIAILSIVFIVVSKKK